MSDLSIRKTVCYSLPLPENSKILNPDQALIIIAKGNTLDFGSICYFKRGSGIYAQNLGKLVDSKSFIETRSRHVTRLIETANAFHKNSGLRDTTLNAKFRTFISFIDWCDTNNQRVLETEALTKVALKNYIDYLKEQVNQSLLTQQTASNYTQPLFHILEHFYNNDNFGQGIKGITLKNVIAVPTTVPEVEDQEKVLAWAKSLFKGLTELVVEKKSYPFALDVPGYLKWPDNRIWAFPVQYVWCCPPGRENYLAYKYWAYDFQNGCLRTVDQIMSLAKTNRKQAETQFKLSNKYLRRSNQDPYSSDRLQRGLLAMQAFMVMFLANTGCNFSQLIEFPWSESLEESVRNPIVERQGFRAIKYRANNRIVHFEVGTEFMPNLRKYLQLRRYLLKGGSCEYLFFNFGCTRKPSIEPVQLQSSSSSSFYRSVKKFLPDFPRIASKQWRVAKQDYLIRNHDPHTAALIMQHSVTTSLKKYSNGSEVNQRNELGLFFNKLNEIVQTQKVSTANSRDIPIGVCSSPNKPALIDEQQKISPDCKSAEGCLFCDKYRVHTDEVDLRKLLSARYFIRKISSISSYEPDAVTYFKNVLSRLEYILNLLKSRDSGLFDRLANEVDDGDLDVFWNAKLQLLIELDLL